MSLLSNHPHGSEPWNQMVKSPSLTQALIEFSAHFLCQQFASVCCLFAVCARFSILENLRILAPFPTAL